MSTTRTDPMAAHRAAQQIREHLAGIDDLRGEIECECGEKHERYLDEELDPVAEKIAAEFTVDFERRVNEHGVAVRRVVLRGPEEVDPCPPANTQEPCGICSGYGCPDCRDASAARETVGASA